MAPRTEPPLQGVRVIDVSDGVAGGYCTRLLAGLGADVIKVEAPDRGDTTRQLGPFPHGRPDRELSALHLHLNAAKRSVTLDIREPDGRAALLKLVAGADLVIDSLSESEGALLELSASHLREANPSLHVVSVTPWGRTGPYSDRPGSELAVEALCGFASMHGEPPREPLKLPGWQMEHFAGTYAAIAALAALLDYSDRPRTIDVAVIDAALLAVETRLMSWEYTGTPPRRAFHTFNRFYPLNVWPCRDGELVLAFYHARDWQGLALLLGDDELRDGERFRGNVARLKNREAVDAKLGPLLAEKTVHEMFEGAISLRSAVGMVMDASMLLSDPHLHARSAIREVEHPVAGRYSMPGAPFVMSDAAWRVERAPLLGEHDAEVLETAVTSRRSAEPPPPATQDGTAGFEPLRGIRVLDLTTAWAGPSATRALGALGADVIKIESSNSYDAWRGPVRPPPAGVGSYADGDPGTRPYERTPLFGTANRNKRAIGLDLSSERGREVFLRLVEQSDVVLSNFSARVLPNLRLDYADLQQVKRDVILLSMPAYGTSGPYQNGVAYGNTMEGMAGLTSRFGYKDGRPVLTHDLTFGDPVAGAHAAVAVLAALLHRRRTGRGMSIDLSQQEALLGQTGEAIVKQSLDGELIGLEGCKAFAHSPHGFYPCRGEDEWIAISADSDAAWSALDAALGLEADARFATNASRLEHEEALDAILAERTAGHEKGDLAALLVDAGVDATPVLRLDELRSDPHIAARHAFEEVDHPEVGRRLYPRLPLTVDGRPVLTARPTPLFAQHNREVFGDLLGMSSEEQDELRAAGVIGDNPKGALAPDASPRHTVTP